MLVFTIKIRFRRLLLILEMAMIISKIIFFMVLSPAVSAGKVAKTSHAVVGGFYKVYPFSRRYGNGLKYVCPVLCMNFKCLTNPYIEITIGAAHRAYHIPINKRKHTTEAA